MISFGGSKENDPVYVLAREHTFGGVVLGDDWVAVVMAHVDPKGGCVYPYWCESFMLHAPQGLRPSLEDIQQGIRACWQKLRREERHAFDRFFVCLPPWSCESQDIHHQVAVRGEWPTQKRCEVQERHVRTLDQRLRAEGIGFGNAISDVAGRRFSLESGKVITNPRGEESRTLTQTAHVVTTDTALVRHVISCLKGLGVAVHAVMSPCVAGVDALTDEEKNEGAVYVDVDRRSVLCSLYAGGALRATRRFDKGSIDIHGWTAQKLGTTNEGLARRVEDCITRPLAGERADDTGFGPLFSNAHAKNDMRVLERAAMQSVGGLLGEIYDWFEGICEEKDLSVHRIVMGGDDQLALGALAEAGDEMMAVPVVWREPENVFAAPAVRGPGFSRLVRFMRTAARGPQPGYELLLMDRGATRAGVREWPQAAVAALRRRAPRLRRRWSATTGYAVRMFQTFRTLQKQIRDRREARDAKPLDDFSWRDRPSSSRTRGSRRVIGRRMGEDADRGLLSRAGGPPSWIL
jgi:hypothetical protein